MVEGHIELRVASRASLGISNMAEDIGTKIKNHQTAPFYSYFLRTRLETVVTATWTFKAVRRQSPLKGVMSRVQMVRACVQIPLPHILVLSWDDHRAEGMFPREI